MQPTPSKVSSKTKLSKLILYILFKSNAYTLPENHVKAVGFVGSIAKFLGQLNTENASGSDFKIKF